jgi:hypothetical protein
VRRPGAPTVTVVDIFRQFSILKEREKTLGGACIVLRGMKKKKEEVYDARLKDLRGISQVTLFTSFDYFSETSSRDINQVPRYSDNIYWSLDIYTDSCMAAILPQNNCESPAKAGRNLHHSAEQTTRLYYSLLGIPAPLDKALPT